MGSLRRGGCCGSAVRLVRPRPPRPSSAYHPPHTHLCSAGGAVIQTRALPLSSSATTGLATLDAPGQKYGVSLPGEHLTANKGAYKPQTSVCGLLALSADKEWLSFASATVAPGTAWGSVSNRWAFVALGQNGSINTMTTSLGHYGMCIHSRLCGGSPSHALHHTNHISSDPTLPFPGGDYFSSAATHNGMGGFYVAGAQTSSSAGTNTGYGVGSVPFQATVGAFPAAPAVNYVRGDYNRFIVVSPWDGRLYHTQNTGVFVSTAGTQGVAPSLAAQAFTSLGLTGLVAPQGLALQSAMALWVADYGAGLKLFTRPSAGATAWTPAPVGVWPAPGSITQVQQPAVSADGSTIFVTTASNVWAFNSATSSWAASPVYTAPANTQLRGVALSPLLAPSPSPTASPTSTSSTSATSTATTQTTPKPTSSVTGTPTTTSSPSETPSNTPTGTATLSVGLSGSSTETATSSSSQSPSVTGTPSVTNTASPSLTASSSATSSATYTNTATRTTSATTTMTSSPAATPAAPFAVGSLILSVVGRGGGVAVSRAAYEQLRLVEVSPAGALVQTVLLPRSTAASGLATPQSPNQRMGMSLPGENPTVNKGAYTPQSAVIGLLSRSGLGEWISWAGTSGPVGTPWNNAFMPWTFAMVNYNGTVNTMTASLGHYGVCARAGACVQRPSATCTHPPPLRPLPHHHPSSIPPRRRLLLGRCNARRQQLLHHRRADLVDAQRLHLWHRPIWPRGGARRLPRQWRHHTHAWQQRPLCDGFAL